ncbi:MAG: hypothetical protein ACQET7_09705 [Thermodesulfobacteriota bacterium]
MPLLIPDVNHSHAEEHHRNSDVFGSVPTISDMSWQDLKLDV